MVLAILLDKSSWTNNRGPVQAAIRTGPNSLLRQLTLRLRLSSALPNGA